MTKQVSPLPPLESQLCFALYGAAMAMGRAYKVLLDQLGVTYPQYLVLQVLWQTDSLTIGTLASRLALDPSTITPLVKRLEKAGLVGRVRDSRDERLVHVHLTPEGRRLEKHASCIAQDVFSQTGLTMTSAETLVQQLQQLRETLAGGISPE